MGRWIVREDNNHLSLSAPTVHLTSKIRNCASFAGKTECKIHFIIMFQSSLFLSKMAICRDPHTTLAWVISSSSGAHLGNSLNPRTQNTGSENNSVAFDDSIIIACLCEHCPIEHINMHQQKASDCYAFPPICHEPKAHTDSSTTSHLNGSKLLYLYIYNILFLCVCVLRHDKEVNLCVCIAKWGPYPCLRLCGTIVIMW